MIKVLFIISNLNPQGPINQLFYLCKYLNKEVVEPYIVTTSQRNYDKSMHHKFYRIGVKIFDLGLSKIQSIFYAKKQIQLIIDDNSIDIIQSFGFRSDIISSNLDRVYKITTVRNTLLYNWKMVHGLILGFILGRVNLYFIKKFQSVVACSHSVYRYLLTLNLASDVIVNCIDLNQNSEILNIDERQYLRLQLGIPKMSLLFITVSSKLKGKNIEFLINTFLENEFVDKGLVIAGFVEPSIRNKYRSNNNIIFIGNVDNFLEYLRLSDYFISASLHEGMPNAVLEAMSVGTPVILSDIPSHREIFESTNLKIGKLFESCDSKDLKNKIEQIRTEEYSLMSRNCFSTVCQNFNATCMANKYCDYYHSKIGRKK